MEKIEASADDLMEQAWMTSAEYMRRARAQIDLIFGDGYAAEHPELVCAFMKTSALDYATSTLAASLQDATEAFTEGMQLLHDALIDDDEDDEDEDDEEDED